MRARALPAAVLFDGGYITDLRTAAAGAVAVKYLARDRISAVGVIGTGAQARLQVQLLAHVRRFETLRVWGRRREAADQCVADLRASGALPPVCARTRWRRRRRRSAMPTSSIRSRQAERRSCVRSGWATAVCSWQWGRMGPTSRSWTSQCSRGPTGWWRTACRSAGSSARSTTRSVAGVLDEAAVVELGQIVSGAVPGRRSDAERIVCDLTGVGVQDVAAAAVVLERARAAAARRATFSSAGQRRGASRSCARGMAYTGPGALPSVADGTLTG